MSKAYKVSTGYCQKYTKKWESEDELKAWIAPDPAGRSDSAFCKYCRTTLSAHKKGLVQHSRSKKHENAVLKDKSALQSKKLDSTFKPTVTDNIKIAELKIAAFINGFFYALIKCVF
ncbi:PREDICTED: uncharacterized protein LOC108360841 [Rhagoletis zephyria]|uniref:uncharacterized protein LOC108360841 n=1 Tax=Rhagoletis zephyria TaxID=28612 RepID=UPI000811856A|nr:PREDICTED: uncharacterized protein LOC108360841 [Rhagoletis zephyria]